MNRGVVRWDRGTGVPQELEGRYEITAIDAEGCYLPVVKVYEDKRGEWGTPHVHTIPWERVLSIKERGHG